MLYDVITLGITPDQLRYDSCEKLYSLDLRELVVPALLLSGAVRGRLADINDIEIVITSYSIHYTKLYEEIAMKDSTQAHLKTGNSSAL